MNERSMNDLVKTEDMTPEQLGGEIRLLTRQARQMVLEYGIQIGYRLQLAKDKVGEDFAGWVERETEISKSSAYRFIKLYNEYGSAQGSLLGVDNLFPTLGNISVSNALRLLAVPEEEREDFALEVDAEHISARELEDAIRERDEARRELAVAVTAHEEAEKALHAAREKELAAEKSAAENARAEAEKAHEEAEALRKKLRNAESGAGEVILLVRLAQENFNLALGKLAVLRTDNSETADKLLVGTKKILETLLGRCG